MRPARDVNGRVRSVAFRHTGVMMGEVLNRAALKGRLDEARAAGKRIVFTNGCFDILHRGHLECLRRAGELGDLLVVGVNTDDSVRRLKGPRRPYVGEADRAALVAALECVDFACKFDEDTPLELIRELRPDVLVKGKDYDISEVVGAEDVRSWGGEVHLIDLVGGLSTSDIIRRIAGAGGGGSTKRGAGKGP